MPFTPGLPRRCAVLLLLLAAGPSAADAQETVPRRPGIQGAAPAETAGPEVTVAQAIRLALDQSPDLQRAALARDGRELAIGAAAASRLPSVTAQVAPTQRYGLSFDQTTGELTSQRVESLNAGVGATLNLYDGGRRRAAVQQARFEAEAAGADLQRAQENVALDVAQRFLQVLLDDELVTVQGERLAAAETQRARIAELLDAGAVPRGDLISQDAVVAQARTAVVEAQGAFARDRAALIQVIGLDPLEPYVFIGPSAETLAALAETPIDGDLAALLARAQVQRADRQALELEVQAARASLGVARATSRPRLDLSADVGTGYSSLQQRFVDLPGGETQVTPVFTQFGDNRSGSVSLSLSVPLFDRFESRRARAQARISADDARLRLASLDRQLAADVQGALVEAQTSAARLTASRAEVEAAQAAARVERDRYALGAGTLFTVSDAEARLAEARSGLAQAAYNLAFRRALVRLAVGDVTAEGLTDVVGL